MVHNVSARFQTSNMDVFLPVNISYDRVVISLFLALYDQSRLVLVVKPRATSYTPQLQSSNISIAMAVEWGNCRTVVP